MWLNLEINFQFGSILKKTVMCETVQLRFRTIICDQIENTLQEWATLN